MIANMMILPEKRMEYSIYNPFVYNLSVYIQ